MSFKKILVNTILQHKNEPFLNWQKTTGQEKNIGIYGCNHLHYNQLILKYFLL